MTTSNPIAGAHRTTSLQRYIDGLNAMGKLEMFPHLRRDGAMPTKDAFGYMIQNDLRLKRQGRQ